MLNNIYSLEKIRKLTKKSVYFMDLTPIEAECIIYTLLGNTPLQISGLLNLTQEAISDNLQTVIRKCGAISIKP